MSSPAVEIAIAVWLFGMGAAVGSFLNVVVYRLPAGMSLVRPGSHCPACKRPIRWYDNVPIVGYLVLGGRCRDCGAAISWRYPTVEAVTALVFLGLGAVEFLDGGRNLPLRPVVVDDGVIFPPRGFGQLGGILAYHLLLICTLLGGALIEWEHGAVPRRLWAPGFGVGAVAPLVWPDLRPVPLWPQLAGWQAGLADGAAGMAVGLLLGLLLRPVVRRDHRLGLTGALGCIGLYLGWQAVAAVAVVAMAFHGVAACVARRWEWARGIPPAVWTLPATLGWLLLWKAAVDRWPQIG